MGLADLFRPKWKHSDVEVRASAVRELGSTETEVLRGIATTDVDAGVRRIAIKKLQDPMVLVEVARNEPDESLRQIASERANSLLVARATSDGDEQTAGEAMEQLSAEDRRFLEAWYLDETEPEKLAKRFGIAVGTVYSRRFKIQAKLTRAVKRLARPNRITQRIMRY